MNISIVGQLAALTNSVPATGGTFTGAVTFASTVLISGALTAAVGIVGTTTNDNAAAGRIGEIITAEAAADSIGSWSTNVAKNIVSLSLTAGDWDVCGSVVWSGATVGTYGAVAVTLVSANIGADPGDPGRTDSPFLSQANSYWKQHTPLVRVKLAAPATVYLPAQIGFTVGTPLAGGHMRARRVR